MLSSDWGANPWILGVLFLRYYCILIDPNLEVEPEPFRNLRKVKATMIYINRCVLQ